MPPKVRLPSFHFSSCLISLIASGPSLRSTTTLICYPHIIEQLGKTKVTGVEQVDTLQDGVHNLVAGQVGQGGLLQPVGDLVSKEGANRAERQGKDEKGSYLPTSLPKVPGGLLG